MKHVIVIQGDNTIRTPGADYGPRSLEFEHRVDNALVLKWPGHKTWVGRGEMAYHKPEWIVGVVVKEELRDETDLHLVVEEIESIPVTKRHKRTRAEAIKLAESHANFRPHLFTCPACSYDFSRTVDGKHEMTVECDHCGAEATYVPAKGNEYTAKKREQ